MVSLPQRVLAPSILAGDHANLAASLAEVEGAGLSWVHLDIMDGHFVPNLSFGPQTVKDLRKRSDCFFDVHLMLSRPDLYIEPFMEAGAQLITIHVEPEFDQMRTLQRIAELGGQRGIALNPDTPIESLAPYLQHVELALVMTVQPGFGGQKFRDSGLQKIQWLYRERERLGLSFRIEVDGGVDGETGRRCLDAGADTLVAGTAFFREPDKVEWVSRLLG
jgi:ribulose-phosphate 3-epimerase